MSVSSIVAEIKQILEQVFPDLIANLNAPVDEQTLIELEGRLELTLPEDFREFYLLHNGERDQLGLVFGLPLLPIEEIYREWQAWQELAAEDYFNLDLAVISVPLGAIKEIYAHPGWLPFVKDWGGNHLAIDLDPAQNGRYGQVFNFGRDENTRYVIALSFADFLAFILAQLRAENYLIHRTGDGPPRLSLKEPKVDHFLDALPELLPFQTETGLDPVTFDQWISQLSPDWQACLSSALRRQPLTSTTITKISSLNLMNSGIDSLLPVVQLPQLRELIATGLAIEDIMPLQHLPQLKTLIIARTNVTDLSPLSACHELVRLSCPYTPVQQVAPLANLTKLQSLSLSQSQVTDFEQISLLKNLRELEVGRNNFESFEGLSSLTKLLNLDLSGVNQRPSGLLTRLVKGNAAKLTNLSILNGLKQLRKLDISDTCIEDISEISSLSNLREIDLSNVRVVDYTPLATLEHLERITCSFAQFQQFKQLFRKKFNFTIRGEMLPEERREWSTYMQQ